jgi:hypothetical protein
VLAAVVLRLRGDARGVANWHWRATARPFGSPLPWILPTPADWFPAGRFIGVVAGSVSGHLPAAS